MTFVVGLQEHVGGDIESLLLRTVGIKNIDVDVVLKGKLLPTEVLHNVHYDIFIFLCDAFIRSYLNCTINVCLNVCSSVAAVHCRTDRTKTLTAGGASRRRRMR